MSEMPDGHMRRHKRPHKGVRIGPELVCAATQAVIRAILDAFLWWIGRGERF
jgi:hypothetical protein